ncbi:sugar transferase [Arenivirga flava]|uniref:Polyprenyl glycosylphosphotransferase n=1 Tax=Arenivirga flava TaxID=1930060 RepID=A0AA37XC43_9MICO|nr:sugar transferase [Arenivirga flava]GMA28067.1 polyprenyl glycosylphosphotransferase [Arenivirga flava]
MSASVASGLARDDWQRRYARRLIVTDFLVVVWAVIGVQLVWLGTDEAAATFTNLAGDPGLGYSFISAGIIALWMLVISVTGSRGPRVIGIGTTEYRILIDWGLRLLLITASIFYFLKLDVARGYVLLAFPIGIAALLASRWLWRQWLRVEREKGRYSSRVILVGSRESVQHFARELARQPWAGYRVIAACVPGEASGTYAAVGGVKIIGGVDDVPRALETLGADTVVVCGSDDLPPQRVRELSWQLESGRYQFVVAPNLTDIGGPRIHTRPVAGLPLIHVETPRYDGMKRYTKRAFDVVATSCMLAILAVPMLIIAVIVKTTSPGGVLFRQERVGLNAQTFHMLKFRSMREDAEQLMANLEQNGDRLDNGGVLFKMREDPRVTNVGRVLRRYSLDELPQLLNVLGGSMSLVGPRPPLAREVSLYDRHVHRRFLVTPGITGLWQVSGRSDLSWEDSVRLDLFYVENWSLTGDLVILGRTARAVARGSGAY